MISDHGEYRRPGAKVNPAAKDPSLNFSTVAAVCLMCLPFSAMAASADDLIAHYRFQTNGDDSLGKHPGFIIPNATYPHSVLYVNAGYESFIPAPPGVGRAPVFRGSPVLTNLDYQLFTVSLDFHPLPERAPKPKRSLNKFERTLDDLSRGRYRRWFGKGDWGKHNILTGGESYRWIGFNRADNSLNLTLNNQQFTHQFKGISVKVNRWHHLICSVNVAKKQILTWFDGKPLETISLPQDFKFDVAGSANEADDPVFTFVNFSNGTFFHGYAADLKIFGRALTEPELAAVSVQALAEMPTFPSSSSSSPTIVLVVAIGVLAGFLVWARSRHLRRGSNIHRQPASAFD